MRLPFLGIIFLALPILEIAGIILVGNVIGLWPTLALILGTSFLGILLLRRNAIAMSNTLRQAVERKEAPQVNLASTTMRSIGAVLMILPGFICKIVGFAFLLPPLQKLLYALVGSKITVMRSGSPFGATSRAGFQKSNPSKSGSTIVDLDDDDFERHSNNQSPWYDGKNGDDPKRIN